MINRKEAEVCLPASELAELMKIPPEKVSSLRVSTIRKEFEKGFKFLKSYGKAATFFGSARFSSQNVNYQEARTLAYKLAQDEERWRQGANQLVLTFSFPKDSV